MGLNTQAADRECPSGESPLGDDEAVAATDWGGYFGYFSDPDGYLWKVTTAA